ncbi:rab-GTPase-TBC domain-containing protein [Kalaharituber pfeilii]|nr:rab-GTPase-TBC domain-containing protein [Kalaharituber pfeilii]
METSSVVTAGASYADSEIEHSSDYSSDSITTSKLRAYVTPSIIEAFESHGSGGSLPEIEGQNDSLTGGSPVGNRESTQSPSHSASPLLKQLSVPPPRSDRMKTLVSPSPERYGSSDDYRAALFDDHVAVSYVPGSLHLAPDDAIQKIIDRLGAIRLIRQLAEDLAHRDRELVLFRLKAEERERTLKKMLVDVEVSNADIERRLATCLNKPLSTDISDRNGDSYTDSINDLMHQALNEEDTFSVVDSASISTNFDDDPSDYNHLITPKATVRVHGKAVPTDDCSVKSTESQKSSKLRGWKDYFWGSRPETAAETASNERQSSVSSTMSKRKSPQNDMFLIASHDDTTSLKRTASHSPVMSTRPKRGEDYGNPTSGRSGLQFSSSLAFHQNSNIGDAENTNQFKAIAMAAESPSEYSSATLVRKNNSDKAASLALKLVADAKSLTQYGYTVPSTPTSPISTRAMAMNSAADTRTGGVRDDLQRIIARNTAKQNNLPRARTTSISSVSSTKAGNHGSSWIPSTIKDRAAGVVPIVQSSTPPDDSFGPVEMDTIVPHAVQPPPLLQSWNDHYPADYLTDRFGFIYDKRTRSNSTTDRAEAGEVSQTSSDMASEILEQSTIVSGGASVLAEGTKSPQRAQASLMERITRPSASTLIPSAPPKVLSEVPIALRTKSGTSTTEESTVRYLLSQLSDMHDSLQRDRSIKWNEFLKKVRAERRRGETEEKGMPEVLMADGELIGVSTLGNSGKGGKQKWKEFRRLVLGGIPVSYRWKVWAECSGACALRVPGYYDELLQGGDDDPLIMSQINMDINRTLTNNIFFRKGPGVQKLKQVLTAYSRRNPIVGYCQGMNMIAASLLLIMPTEEDAFWVLVSIVENILPKTYFEQSLLASRADQTVLKLYVKEVLPQLDAHLRKLGVELEALTFQWFLSVFTDCLAGEALFRVWDVLLCIDGSTFLFQTALALLRLNERALLQCNTAAAVYSYLNSNMTHQGISIDGLIQASDALRSQVKRVDVEMRRELAIKRELSLNSGKASTYAGSVKSNRSNQKGTNENGAKGGEPDRQNARRDPVDVGDVMEGESGVAQPGPSQNHNQIVRNSTPSPPAAPWL